MDQFTKESFVYIPSGNYQLAAMISHPVLPLGQVPPVVLLCHGFGGNKTEACRNFFRIANLLCSHGCMTVRFDFSGFGDSLAPSTAFSISQGVDDIRAVISYLEKESYGSIGKLGILGFSFGGLVAAYALGAGIPIQRACLVSAVNHFITPEKNPSYHKSDVSDRHYYKGLPLSQQFIEEYVNCNGAEQLRDSRVPVQLIYGTDDKTVSLDHMEAYAEVLHNESFPPVVVEGADHCFTKVRYQRLLDERIVSFFSTFLF